MNILCCYTLLAFLTMPLLIIGQKNQFIKYPDNSNIEILMPGNYKKGEFDKSLVKKEWWGVYEINNVSFVKKVKLKLNKLKPDVQYDWEYQVSIEDESHCLFLVTGLDLSDKEFNNYATNDVIYSNQNYTFEFGPYHTFLSTQLQNFDIKQNEVNYHTVKINLETREKLKSQKLFDFPCTGDLTLRLTWAGDLDDDGKTDFLIQIPTLPNNEIGYGIGLFLSSTAKHNELVKFVAFFLESGC